MRSSVHAKSLLWRGAVLALAVAAAFLATDARPASAETVASVSSGRFHTCALTTEGGVKCWGGKHTGRLGDGTFKDRTTPVDVSGLTVGVASIFAGDGHTCALTTAGSVKCWGRNSSGQLGDGHTSGDFSNVPVPVTGLASGGDIILIPEIPFRWEHICRVVRKRSQTGRRFSIVIVAEGAALAGGRAGRLF